MSDNHSSAPSTGGIRFWLIFLSINVVLATLAIAGVIFADEPQLRHYNIPVAVALAGLVMASVLWFCAKILALLGQRATQLMQLEAVMSKLQQTLAEKPIVKQTAVHHDSTNVPATTAAAPPPTYVAPAAARIPEGYQIMPDVYPLLDAMHEVRDILLMSEDQRAAMRKQRELTRRQQAIEAIHAALDQGMWELAVTRMADLATDDPAREDLQKRIAAQREEARAKAIGNAREQLHHLMAIGEWTRAQEIAAELLARFPDDSEARQQAAIVSREYEAFMREQITHMFADLKAATDGKDWRRALLLAENLVSRYPNDPEISRLQMDLPTLRENADAQERREEEALFKDLLLGQRYEEAMQVAQRVMNRFPGSPTAVELEKLLPKVRQLAEKK